MRTSPASPSKGSQSPSLEQICRDLGLDPARLDAAFSAFMRNGFYAVIPADQRETPLAFVSRQAAPSSALELRAALAAFLAELRPARPKAKPKPLYGLTVEQAKAIHFIRDYTLQRNGIAPSYDEIAAHLGIRSKSNIHRIMTELRARGAVTWIANHARSIVVIDDSARNHR